MKKIILVTICLGVCILSIWKFQVLNSKFRKENLNRITIGSQKLSVEVANSPAEITLGLGQRDVLGSDGMLFVMPNRSIPTFWMKDMRFDLDFVWIDRDVVVDVTENVPAQQGIGDVDLKIYSPRFAVTHVLEIGAGEIKARGMKIGDKVQL